MLTIIKFGTKDKYCFFNWQANTEIPDGNVAVNVEPESATEEPHVIRINFVLDIGSFCQIRFSKRKRKKERNKQNEQSGLKH